LERGIPQVPQPHADSCSGKHGQNESPLQEGIARNTFAEEALADRLLHKLLKPQPLIVVTNQTALLFIIG
jgi:hypothetical protein